jgi:4-hydroxybenzoate polyprenyltransferase
MYIKIYKAFDTGKDMLEKMKLIAKLMRPHQYIKNGFVFIGIVFGHHWDIHSILMAFLVFVAFCCISSSVYIFNDIIDMDIDKNHPKKSMRPLPAGLISVPCAYSIMLVLMSVAFGVSVFVNNTISFLIFCYFLLNLAYSVWLKNIVILDIFMISSGFMCRILAGTLGLNIDPSQWLLLCGFTITLFLGFSKRFSEIKVLENIHQEMGTTRAVLIHYNFTSLERFMTISAACTIMSYACYTVSIQTLAIHKQANLVYSVPIVIYGIFRYLHLVYAQNKGSDTSKDIFTDKHMFMTLVLWLGTIVWLLK